GDRQGTRRRDRTDALPSTGSNAERYTGTGHGGIPRRTSAQFPYTDEDVLVVIRQRFDKIHGAVNGESMREIVCVAAHTPYLLVVDVRNSVQSVEYALCDVDHIHAARRAVDVID